MQPAQKYRYNSKIYTVEKGNKERESERTEIDVTRNQKKKAKHQGHRSSSIYRVYQPASFGQEMLLGS